MNLRPIYWNYIRSAPTKRRTSRKLLTKRRTGILHKIQFNPKNCASFCGICRKYFRNARVYVPRNSTSLINGENLLAICCLASTTIRLNCIKQMCCCIVVLNANFLIKIFEQFESPEGGDERSKFRNEIIISSFVGFSSNKLLHYTTQSWEHNSSLNCVIKGFWRDPTLRKLFNLFVTPYAGKTSKRTTKQTPENFPFVVSTSLALKKLFN